MNAADRAKIATLARDLEAIEADDAGTVEQRRALAAIANELRRQAGVEPFPDEEENPPELEFHRRARSLGMVEGRSRPA